MPALFIFLFKVNIALVLFCLGYYLVLRHLTFYNLNRIYLVGAILFSTLYPNINLSDFAQRHQQLTEPVQTVILNWKAPAEKFVKPLYQPNYWQWVEIIFWAGVILFAARLIMQLFSLYKLYRQSKPGQVYNHRVRLISSDIGPFSFWRNIYIDPSKLSPAELKNVLEHEQVHVSEWHTLDILIAELSTIFYWFNPGIWLMKKAVRENIEFITDQKILKKGVDSKEYQYSLVSVSFATSSNTIVNHFNISTIKKRIIMMNSKRSSGYNLTRYVFLVPAVIALLLIFSLSKAEVSKKSLHTFKSIATAISGVPSTYNDQLHSAIVKENVGKQMVVKASIKTIDTIYNGKSKDGKKFFFMSSDQKRDSLDYVINGVKGSKTELDALDPGNIQSLELLNADKGKEFFPEADGKHQVLFITTEDSEAGKKLKEKMDKSFRGGKFSLIKNISISRNGDYSDNARVPTGAFVAVAASSESDDDAPIVSTSSSSDATNSVIVVAPKVSTHTTTRLRNHVYINSAPKNTVTGYAISSDGNADSDIIAGSVTSTKPIRILYTDKADALTLDNFSNKLIIIDGKKASSEEMKKISVNDLNKLSVLNAVTATSLYGDKGKNGAILITTKKGK